MIGIIASSMHIIFVIYAVSFLQINYEAKYLYCVKMHSILINIFTAYRYISFSLMQKV